MKQITAKEATQWLADRYLPDPNQVRCGTSDYSLPKESTDLMLLARSIADLFAETETLTSISEIGVWGGNVFLTQQVLASAGIATGPPVESIND